MDTAEEGLYVDLRSIYEAVYIKGHVVYYLINIRVLEG